jgi:hypothetical protein
LMKLTKLKPKGEKWEFKNSLSLKLTETVGHMFLEV